MSPAPIANCRVFRSAAKFCGISDEKQKDSNAEPEHDAL
jgi:hypothetical protein